MKVIRIEPSKEPRLMDALPRTIERHLDGLIHEEELPIEGTMSLSALRTDGLEPNQLMIDRTGDDGYYGTVYICAVWYEGLDQEQINALLDWLEDGVPPSSGDDDGYPYEGYPYDGCP